MKSGTKYKLGDVVIVPFPFTDLSGTRQRPVLVISNNHHNQTTEDIVVCGITSNITEQEYSVIIDNNSLIEGRIPLTSRIKVNKLFTLKQNLIKKEVAKVKLVVLKKVKQELSKLLIL